MIVNFFFPHGKIKVKLGVKSKFEDAVISPPPPKIVDLVFLPSKISN